MGKYEDAIGEVGLRMVVKEAIDKDSAKKADDFIEGQREKWEEPVKMSFEIATKSLKDITQKAEQIQQKIDNAIASKKSFKSIERQKKNLEGLEAQAKEYGKVVGKNDKTYKQFIKTLNKGYNTINNLNIAQSDKSATKALQDQAKAANAAAEAQIKLTRVKDASGKTTSYTAIDKSYSVAKNADTGQWDIYEASNNKLIASCRTLNDVRRNSILLAAQEAAAQSKVTAEIQEQQQAQIKSNAIKSGDSGIQSEKKHQKAIEGTTNELEQLNAELEKEKQALKDIESSQAKNNAARAALSNKKDNYGQEVLGTNKAVYDTDKIKNATSELDQFNAKLEKRNQFQDKYNKLCSIVSSSFVGQYGIDQGFYKDLDSFIQGVPSMKQLSTLATQGITGTPTKQINQLFDDVVRELNSSLNTTKRYISSGDIVGTNVVASLEAEEISLGQEQQRLNNQREAQLSKVANLEQRILTLNSQQVQQEAKVAQEAQEGANAKQQQANAAQQAAQASRNQASAENQTTDLVVSTKTRQTSDNKPVQSTPAPQPAIPLLPEVSGNVAQELNEIAIASERVAKTGQKVKQGIDTASQAIANEGKQASAAAGKKDAFAQANERVAQSGRDAARGVDEATDAINEEGNAAGNGGDSDNEVRARYDALLDTVTKINNLDKDILKFQDQANGTNMFDDLIADLQSEKQRLVQEFNEIENIISAEMAETFSQGDTEYFMPEVSFVNDRNGLLQFLNDAETQGELTTQQINRLATAFQNASKMDVDVTKRTQRLADLEKAMRTVYNFSNDGSGNFTFDDDLDETSTELNNVRTAYQNVREEINRLTSENGDRRNWTAQDVAGLERLVSEFNKYVNVLDSAKKKEKNYFAGKTQYTSNIDIDTQPASSSNVEDSLDSAKAKLSAAAQEFAKGEAIITGFKKSADGISHLDFSVFDSVSNKMRTFTMEMGSVTKGMYNTETTINRELASIKSAETQIASMSNLIQQINNKGIDVVSGSEGANSLQRMVSLMKQLQDAANKGDAKLINEILQESKMATNEVNKLYKEALNLQNAIDDGTAKDIGAFTTGDDAPIAYDQMTQAIKKQAVEMGNAYATIGKYDEKQNKLNYTITDGAGIITHYTASFNPLNNAIVAQQKGITKLQTGWQHLKASVTTASKSMLMAFSGYNVFSQTIQTVRKGVTYIKDIDLAMTELKKVTDETENSYAKFLDTAAQTGSKIGATTSDFVNATADFARIGYSMEEAGKMAEAAIVYKNVADGLDTVEAATESITSTMKAFGIESSDTMSIIDSFNEVGNNFAITSAGIGEALKRSASALHEGGNTMEESIGLITGANTVVQDPEVVGELLPRLYSNIWLRSGLKRGTSRDR